MKTGLYICGMEEVNVCVAICICGKASMLSVMVDDEISDVAKKEIPRLIEKGYEIKILPLMKARSLDMCFNKCKK